MNGEGLPQRNYEKVKRSPGKLWSRIEGAPGRSTTGRRATYIAEPPFFDGFSMKPPAAKLPA
jgi:aconitate hydratase